jgi:hypothetical protein
MLTPTFDLLCAICFSLYTNSAAQRGAVCGAMSEKRPDACPGKLITTEPRSIKPQRKTRKRGSADATEADEAAEAVAK